MAATATINAKVEPTEKAAFIATAESLGLSPSSAIKVFARAFIDQGGFPFEVRRPVRLSSEGEASYLELMADIKAGTAKSYSDFGEILAEIDAEIAEEDALDADAARALADA
jgi:DNA-damage-inducible protein J